MSERCSVLLLFGGQSAEHDVSRVSAAAVARALGPDRYDVIPVGISVAGTWHYDEDVRACIRKGGDAIPDALPVTGTAVALLADPTRPALIAIDDPERPGIAIDVVFPVLHGPFGEDGTMQGLCEMAQLAYVGSGVVASAVGMDKRMMKRAFQAAGLPLTPYEEVRAGTWNTTRRDEIVARLGLPCFVKPANMGSSVGVSKAKTRSELDDAIALAHCYDEWVICETAVEGREIEVAVLGDLELAVSVPGEIIPGDEFYSYADKYEDDNAQLLAPAVLSQDEAAIVQRLARDTFRAIGAEGLARVDMFYDDRPDGMGVVVNEINTMPGFTSISMFPRLWECSGVSYPELCDRLIAYAQARHARRVARVGRQRNLD
ncbi:MAG: D-alanine--D-alanine ligase family protein [Acidimicrobiia bacterium]